MERKNFRIPDEKVQKAFDEIQKNALGNPIILETAPNRKDVKSNNLAVHGSDIYIRAANGKLLKITGVEVTD